MAQVIIGANWGDEGKGLLTDYYAHLAKNPLVVRFNGGAQAGHTVVTDTNRHVFSHFGSGTFVGAPTYLSRYFISNPTLFRKEYEELVAKGIKPTVFVDGRSRVTTPYDMIINAIIELARGDAKHGSCGAGINETVVRSESSSTVISIWTLPSSLHHIDINSNLFIKLKFIREHWVPERLKHFLTSMTVPATQEFIDEIGYLLDALESESVTQSWLDDVIFFKDHVNIIQFPELAKRHDIIFEGAQGLALDQNSSDFPYVTRSNTGLDNVLDLVREAKIQNLNVTYVTRSYFTRHGAGPFPNGQDEPLNSKMIDETNRPNKFQGSLRFAPMDISSMMARIRRDFDKADRLLGTQTTATLAITCLDQTNNDIITTHGDIFLSHLRDMTSFQRILVSRGPTRDKVEEFPG